MTKFTRTLLILCFSLFAVGAIAQPTLIPVSDELILPQYAINGGTTASRLQFVTRLRLTGLLPSSTYRYFTGASTNAALTTTAPGNMYAINDTATNAGFIAGYTSSKSMSGTLLGGSPNENENSTTGRYAEFTTDANGTYTGWFAFAPTGNAVFTAGNDVYVYIQLNDGNGGTTIASSYRTTSTVHMLAYGTTSAGTNQATALRGTSNAANENMIFLYDNTSAAGRPVYGTWAENDGITSGFTNWYGAVETTSGSWGAIIPNALANGIQRVDQLNVANGLRIGCPAIEPDGDWNGTNTINPSSGTTALVISTNFAAAPFTAATSQNSPVCTGDTITLTAGPAGLSYVWNGPNGFTSTADTNLITASASAAGDYMLSVTDQNGCISYDTATITINPLPQVTISSQNMPFCENGAVVTLTGSSPAGGTYSGTGISGSDFDPSVAGVGIHTITYTFTDANGCTNNASTPFEVFASPSVNTSSVSDVCENGNEFFLTFATPAGGVYTGNGVSGDMFDPAIAGSGSHTITYTYTDQNGCADQASESIMVNAAPSVTFDPLADLCTDGAPVTLSGGFPSSGTYSGPGVTNDVFDPASTGSGDFILTYTYMDQNGCMDSASQNQHVDICTDIIERADSKNIIVYPNPAHDAVFVNMNVAGYKTIKIVNMVGATVFETNTNEQLIKLNIEQVSKGIYFIEIDQAGDKMFEKLIIE
jgi:hypothetical protein